MPYKDPEKAKEHNKKYHQENKEKILERVKKYREENKEKILEQRKKHYEENRDELLEEKKKYYQENKEKIKEKKKKYYQKNKDKAKEYNSKYYQKNKDNIRAHNTTYRNKKYHTDPCYKLRQTVKVSIRQALKGGKGGQSFLPYVDWTIQELKEHLESKFEPWMTWENHGVCHPTENRWHIDHIMPQSVLLEGVETMDHPKFRECWALKNLQPLEARENMSKGSKIL